MTKLNSSSLLCLAIAIASGLCRAREVSYDGFSLYRCEPQTENQVNHLRLLMEQKGTNGIMFWTEPRGANEQVDIMVSPDDHQFLHEQLKLFNVPSRMIMHNVGEAIKASDLSTTIDGLATNNSKAYQLGDDFYSRYQPYSTIESKLNELAAADSRVSLEVAGLSYEKRNIYLVKVSNNATQNKPVIFLDAGHHAREWISHSTLMYILESLINDNMPAIEGVDLEASKSLGVFLDRYDFWFVPVVNPDGYVYTHTTDRLWRKTRSRSGYCPGVDPNRNYPFHWGEAGGSKDSCDETYAGPRALSEPECAQLASILESNQDRIKVYISLHSYSQLMLVPYGYARLLPANYPQLSRIALAGIDGIAGVRGTKYGFGTAAKVLYPAAGDSNDFAYGQANIRLPYIIELPDTGDHGFLLPTSEIVPVGHETVVGISAMMELVQADS